MTQPIINKSISAATKGIALSADTAFPPTRAVNCDSAGTATVTWSDGGTSSYYFRAGDNPVSITQFASGGSAGNLVGLY